MAEQTCSPHWKALPQRSIYANNLQDSIPTKQSECSEDDSAPDCISSKADDPISSIQQLGNSSGYEYLDHTADVQIHCWGNSWESAFAAAGLSLFGYMTDLKTVKPDPEIGSIHIQAQGHDLYSLLYKFLDECLFQYGANYIILCQLEVTRIQLDGLFLVEAIGQGEVFDTQRHPQGTEIKAITYSAMQITKEEGGQIHMYFIVDI
ncbi:hypothetical protein GAYE_PCTG36G1016 [Galdieria yellowstonensis]|uniref:Protein archease-like n=1 Tax=Galdieria yellowstonensis TaxID=3028027 RepID=A0AAV9I718_9RHOD|nr:hypothetical protein GAYE_PCTG36G1016 [Galdieria yellowstonensis]